MYFSSDAPELSTSSDIENMVDVGATLTLNCGYVSVPQPNVTWTLNGSVDFLTVSAVSVTDSSTTSTLTFTNVTPATARGTYACNISNLLGEVYKKFNVLVACESFQIGFCY